MKKTVLKSSLLAGVVSLLFSFSVLKSGSLTDITKPYLGEYECQRAIFDGKDYAQEFSYIRLTFSADNTFTLSYKTKEGLCGSEKGEYSYDEEKEEVTLFTQGRHSFKRTFPLVKGNIYMSLRLGDKTLQVQFGQK